MMPVARVQTPQGVVKLDVPEGTTPEQIEDFVKNKLPQQAFQQDDPGFLSRVGERAQEREQRVQDIRAQEQTPVESVLQQAGQGAAFIGDIAGEALQEAGEGISAITPEPIKEFIGQEAKEIAETDIFQAGVKALQAGGEIYQKFKESNPRVARNLEAAVNVGLITAPAAGRAAPKPTGPTAIGKAADVVEDVAKKQTLQQKKGFVSDLIKPKQTPTVRAEQVGRTVEEGILGRKRVIPSLKESSIIDEVAQLPVDPKKSIQSNFNLIQSEIKKEALSLENSLKKHNVIFPRKEYNAQLRAAKESLSANPLLVGDAQKTAQRIINKMDSITKNNPSNALGLLKSRKQLDNWIKSQKGGSIFDPKNENALSIALREIRNTTNDFIDSKATNVAVKQSLKKQSNLYGALDNIAPKAADEAGNILGRLVQNTAKAIPLRGELAKTIAGTGLVTGAALSPSIILPVAAGVGAVKTVKLIKSPKVKKAISEILRKSDRAIRVTKDKNLIRELKADRAALLSILNGEEDEGN